MQQEVLPVASEADEAGLREIQPYGIHRTSASLN
jgi:hypothetical protein